MLNGAHQALVIDICKKAFDPNHSFFSVGLSKPTRIDIYGNCQTGCTFKLTLNSGNKECKTDIDIQDSAEENEKQTYPVENISQSCLGTAFDILKDRVTIEINGTFMGDWIRIFFNTSKYVECKMPQDSADYQIVSCSYPIASWQGI